MVCRQSLSELQREAAFWSEVREVRGLEKHVRLLFQFCRRDTLARMRLYRDKLVGLGREGRWVLEDMKHHPEEQLRQAAIALLRVYDKLERPKTNE